MAYLFSSFKSAWFWYFLIVSEARNAQVSFVETTEMQNKQFIYLFECFCLPGSIYIYIKYIWGVKFFLYFYQIEFFYGPEEFYTKLNLNITILGALTSSLKLVFGFLKCHELINTFFAPHCILPRESVHMYWLTVN